MSVEILTVISVVLLIAMFIVGTKYPINMGIIGLAAAYVVGSFVAGLSADEIMSGFPVDLFIILTGVTFFFNILQKNGTIDLITSWTLRLVQGRKKLIPWAMYFLELLLCSIGTQGTAAIIIVAPIAMRLAEKIKFSQLGMALLVAWGMCAGIFSPLNVMGIVVGGVMREYNVPMNPNTLFLLTILFSLLLSVITYFVFTSKKFSKLNGEHVDFNNDDLSDDEIDLLMDMDVEATTYRKVSLLSLVLLVVLGMFFGVNMGFAGLILGLFLSFARPEDHKEVVASIPWGIILMVSGIVTYVGMMEQIGVMDYITTLISQVDSPKLALLVTCYIGGVVSAFVSTTGLLGGIIPLIIPMLVTGNIWIMGAIAAVCISSSIVDICPFSTTGAIFVANAQGVEAERFYSKLLNTSIFIIAVGPLLAWLVYVAFF